MAGRGSSPTVREGVAHWSTRDSVGDRRRPPLRSAYCPGTAPLITHHSSLAQRKTKTATRGRWVAVSVFPGANYRLFLGSHLVRGIVVRTI
jgi:hypothetical protein